MGTLRRGEYSSNRMGSFWLPLGGSGLGNRRRNGDERTRSGTDGSGMHLGVHGATCCSDPPTDGEVRLIFSIPPESEGEVLKAARGSFGVRKALEDLLERDR